MSKKGLQASFAWLFAIIVGVIIIFLAIYLSTRLIDTGRVEQDAKTGKNIGILLNPLEMGFESVRATSLTFPVETRVYNKCGLGGEFGKQLIEVSQISFGEWTETNMKIGFPNKYVFSKEPVEGRRVYLFSKSFSFPFKVADLIFMTSTEENYCFEGLDSGDEGLANIKAEIEVIKQGNFFTENCTEGSTRVCFGPDISCEINVDYYGGAVEKADGTSYFDGDALMYAAIFSEKENYECQLKRLMQRTSSIANLQKDKATFVSRTGCSSNMNPDLIGLINYLSNQYEGSENLGTVKTLFVEELDQKNSDNGECKLW